MARRTQFGQLVTQLRNEVGRSNVAGASGVADYGMLKQVLNRHYEALYLDYDWPHLRFTTPLTPLSAGDAFKDIPSGMDYERIEDLKVWTNGRPIPTTRGIEISDYAIFSTPSGDRSSPVQKWDIRFTGTVEQFEFWPMPDDNAQSFQVIGFKKFARLIADADLCLLDDNLVVGFAAAEVLGRADPKFAQTTLGFAQALYDKLRGRTKAKSGEDANFTSGSSMPQKPVFVVRVK
jgi:hypothetical protein